MKMCGLTAVRGCALCVGAMLAASLCLAGCSSPQLRVVTDPPGSTVTVKDASGKVILKPQQAPVKVAVRFPRVERYIVEAVPTEANTDRYLATTDEVTESRYLALPGEGDQVRQLTLKLDEKDYLQLRVIRLMLDPEQGWVGFVTEERAYKAVAEMGGAVPNRIVEFDDDDIGIAGMSLDPAGERIVYSATEYEVADMDVIKELRLDEHRDLPLRHANLRAIRLVGARVTGGGTQHITAEDFKDMYPSFTHDGEHVLFSSNRRRADSMDLLRTSAEGRGGISDIYTDLRGARVVKPSQGSDSTVAFAMYPAGWSEPSDVQIWTVGGRNEFPTQITSGIQPQISPDGSHIAYIGPDGNLWVLAIDGTYMNQLTRGASRIIDEFKASLKGAELAQFESYEDQGTVLRHYHAFSFPSWSPDGQSILFTSMQGIDPTQRHNEDVWIMDRDGASLTQLTTNGSVDRYPLMSPDGQYIYFMSNRGLKWAIWRIAAPDGIGSN